MKKISFEDVLILNAIRLGRFCVRVLPIGVAMAVARLIGRLVYATSKRRRIAYKNLRMAFAGEKSSKELKRIARASMENLAMSGVDLLRIPEMNRQYVEKYFRIEGREKFEPYIARGQGVIFLTGHFGSWELLNIAGGLLGYPMVALARVQKHPRSDAYLNQLRASKGSQVIHKGMPVREILRALRRGQVVGILSDQDGGKNGSFVRFFNRLSSTPAGVATFALRTGAAIVPGFIFREKNHRHRIELESPLELPNSSLSSVDAERFLLQQFADTLEKKIRRSPEQWLWAHRRWKSSPDRKVVILSDDKPGHLNQSLVLYEALRRERQAQGFSVEGFQKKVIEVRFRNGFLKKFWKLAGFLFHGCPPFADRLLKWVLMPECACEITESYADIVISCGWSLTEINLWMKKENLAKSMVVMKPANFSKKFDVVIAPRHDHLAPADNIFETDGALFRLDEQEMRRQGAKLATELGLSANGKRLGLLVGGDAARLIFDKPLFEAFMNEVRRAALFSGVMVLATTSRRTPGWADRCLKEIFSDPHCCPLLVIANEANRPGVVAGIIALSDVILVSGESMSMVSEAVSSGKPVIVFSPWKKASFKRKYQHYLSALEKKGLIRHCTHENLEEILEHQMQRSLTVLSQVPDSCKSVLSQAAKRIF